MNKGIFASGGRKSPSIGLAAEFKTRVLGDSGTFEGEACLVNQLQRFRFKEMWDRASIVLTANGFKSGKLYAIKKIDGSTDFTASGGGGSRRNASGNIVSLSSGWPKVDFTSGCGEIINERAATNILLNSETLATQNLTTVAGPYVLSFYGTGSVTINEGTPVVLNGTGANDRVYVVFTSTGGSKTVTVTGSVKNAQLEAINNTVQYNFPTSWIPTTSSTVTRSINTLQRTGLSSASVINQEKGTIIFRLSRRGVGRIFRFDDGTDNNQIRFNNTGDAFDRIEVAYTKNGSTAASTVLINPPADITVALRYSENTVTIYLNGAFFHTVTNTSVASGLYSRVAFSTTQSASTWLKYFVYIPDTSTTDELIKYSTP